MMTEDIISYTLSTLKDTILLKSFGEYGVFYNPNKLLKKGIYILTIKDKDGDNDRSSMLNREGIFCLNIGLRKQTFINMFNYIPKRPPKGKIVDMNFDFTITDLIMPHPVYAWMSWIRILNPSKKTFEQLKPLINESYEFAKEKFIKRK